MNLKHTMHKGCGVAVSYDPDVGRYKCEEHGVIESYEVGFA